MRLSIAENSFVRRSPFGAICALVALVACALALCVAAGTARAATPPSIPYSGETIAFYASDLSKRFGMLSNPGDEVEATLSDGYVTMTWVPSNNRVYRGFYLNAAINDRSTWNESNFVAPTGDHYTLTLPESYCGAAWPVAPDKADGSGSTADQYYLTIPPRDKIKPAIKYYTVTFTDGMGGVLSVQDVEQGKDATAPATPSRDGFRFMAWDRPYAAVAGNLTINALWGSLSGTDHLVTFENGYGGVIINQVVEDGAAASAPENPVRDGYVFDGWNPSDLSNIKSDLTVRAQWITVDQAAATEMGKKIEKLPADPKTVLRDTENQVVAETVEAYVGLSAGARGLIADAERLHLARCAIAVLPSDPFKVTASHRTAITSALEIMNSLPEGLQAELDSGDVEKAISSSRSYGRYLENAVWALYSLRPVNNVTLLPSGTYTGQVKSTSSMGKSNSARAIGFTVKSVSVKDGKLMAIVEHGSNSSQSLRLGGVDYQNLETDPLKKSYYEIPISLNSTFYFSVKGKNATDDTDAITYEMTVTADEASMTPDSSEAVQEETGGTAAGSSDASGTQSGSGSGSGTNLNTMLSNKNSKSESANANRQELSGVPISGADGTNGTLVGEMGSSIAAALEKENLMPAVAGMALLLVSLGALSFTTWFVRREAAFR